MPIAWAAMPVATKTRIYMHIAMHRYVHASACARTDSARTQSATEAGTRTDEEYKTII